MPENAQPGAAGNLIRWDWKDQPPWGEINDRLRDYGVSICSVDTGGDEYAVTVRPNPAKALDAYDALDAFWGYPG